MSATGAPAANAAIPAPPKPGTRESLLLNIGFFAMVIGMFMAILDIQIVAASIAQIQAGVSASAEEIAWIQTSYLIAEVIGIPLSGLLNRALSMRRLFVYSCIGFTASSVLCALAWDLNSLIVFRCIQGFLGAAMIPTTMAAAFSLFGPNRSMLQQVAIGMVATLAPSIGPTLGGWITEHLSWHWLFLVNVIPGIVASTLVWNLIPKTGSNLSLIRNIDIIGLAAMALFLGSFEYLFEEGPANGWFEESELVMWAFVCSIAGALFFWRALTRANPVVDLTVFKDSNFALAAAVATIVGFGLFGAVYLTPLFLGQVRGFNALQIGQIMSVGGVAMFIGGPIAGALIRKFDPRYVLALGLTLSAIGLYWNQFLTAELVVLGAVLAAGIPRRRSHYLDGAVQLHRAWYDPADEASQRHRPRYRLPQPRRRSRPRRPQHHAPQLQQHAYAGTGRRDGPLATGSSVLAGSDGSQPSGRGRRRSARYGHRPAHAPAADRSRP